MVCVACTYMYLSVFPTSSYWVRWPVLSEQRSEGVAWVQSDQRTAERYCTSLHDCLRLNCQYVNLHRHFKAEIWQSSWYRKTHSSSVTYKCNSEAIGKWVICMQFVLISWDFTITGKHYYEVSCHDQGLCRVGWSTMQASLDLGKCFCNNWAVLYLYIFNILFFLGDRLMGFIALELLILWTQKIFICTSLGSRKDLK